MGRRSRKEIWGKVVALPRWGKGLEDTEGRVWERKGRDGGRERGRKEIKTLLVERGGAF